MQLRISYADNVSGIVQNGPASLPAWFEIEALQQVATSTTPQPIVFNVYSNGGQNFIALNSQQIQLQNKVFDPNQCFNNTAAPVILNGLSTPAYSFCPNVAGYYAFNFSVRQNNSTNEITAYIGKNGNNGVFAGSSVTNYVSSSTGSGLVYLNGQGDFIQLYAYTYSATLSQSRVTTVGGQTYGLDTFLSGKFVSS
jgi:hypothetical protein